MARDHETKYYHRYPGQLKSIEFTDNFYIYDSMDQVYPDEIESTCPTPFIEWTVFNHWMNGLTHGTSYKQYQEYGDFVVEFGTSGWDLSSESISETWVWTKANIDRNRPWNYIQVIDSRERERTLNQNVTVGSFEGGHLIIDKKMLKWWIVTDGDFVSRSQCTATNELYGLCTTS